LEERISEFSKFVCIGVHWWLKFHDRRISRTEQAPPPPMTSRLEGGLLEDSSETCVSQTLTEFLV